MKMRQQSGFTLIELVMVIVILGILAAFALPRFADMTAEARASALEGLAGSLRSASAMAHALQLATNVDPDTGTVTMEGQAVALFGGYPEAGAAGISAAISDMTGFTQDATSSPAADATGVMVWTNGGTVGTCNVTYSAATTPPTITTTTTNCN